MNNDERMMEAFGGMFDGNIKEKLEKQKKESEIKKNKPIEKENKKANIKNATNTKTSKRLTRKEGETRGRKAILHSNYSIMFELDENLIDYFQQAIYLTRNTKKEYLNKLVRKDLIERLGMNFEDFKEPKRIDFPEMNEEEFDNFKNKEMAEQNKILEKEWENYKKQWLKFINQ